jgi:protocatechuate 3,4-dioxygenase alpha subunit
MPARTPSQTVGPYFALVLPWPDGARVAFAEGGARVSVAGRVLDGEGHPVPDALIETWQRSPAGTTPQPASGASRPNGFARVAADGDGAFRIETAMPGGAIACLEVIVLARGLLKALHTRVYLAPEAQVRGDPALKSIAASPRVSTLVARPVGDGAYAWDVRLQGEGETVFFAT